MKAYRQLASLIVAVIVLIAAGMMPSAARAHAGHDHTAARSQPAAAAPDVAAKPLIDVTLQPADQALMVVGATSRSFAGSAPAACGGLCCGTGLVCCSPAMMPGSAHIHAPQTSERLTFVYETRVHPSIAAEALPKPPRPFA